MSKTNEESQKALINDLEKAIARIKQSEVITAVSNYEIKWNEVYDGVNIWPTRIDNAGFKLYMDVGLSPVVFPLSTNSPANMAVQLQILKNMEARLREWLKQLKSTKMDGLSFLDRSIQASLIAKIEEILGDE